MPLWEPGIVILLDVRETDCMTAICSWKAGLLLVAFHSVPSLGWLHGEWLESLGGLTGSWQTPLPLAFITSRVVWSTLVELVILQTFPTVLLLFWGAVFLLTNQTSFSNCSDFFPSPQIFSCSFSLANLFPCLVFDGFLLPSCVHLYWEGGRFSSGSARTVRAASPW